VDVLLVFGFCVFVADEAICRKAAAPAKGAFPLKPVETFMAIYGVVIPPRCARAAKFSSDFPH